MKGDDELYGIGSQEEYKKLLGGEMEGNGKGEGELVKKCPFLGGWCIKDGCSLWTEITQRRGVMVQKQGVCAFAAMVVILSEVNMKTQVGGQQVRIPKLYRG